MRRHNRIHPCRGVTLVELVGVMIASSALMAVTIVALVAVQRADTRFSRKLSDRHAASPLAEQLRQDVHAAKSANWDAAANRLTLTTPAGGSVTYEQESKRWNRYVVAGPEQTPQLAGAFPAPEDVSWTITPPAAEAGALVHIAWTSGADSPDQLRTTPLQVEVVATVGRDLALLQQ